MILAISKPKSDTLVQHKTGIAVPIRDAEKLAEAIIFCINNKEKLKKMGKMLLILQKNFDPKNSLKILKIYKNILNNEIMNFLIFMPIILCC